MTACGFRAEPMHCQGGRATSQVAKGMTRGWSVGPPIRTGHRPSSGEYDPNRWADLDEWLASNRHEWAGRFDALDRHLDSMPDEPL